MAMLAVLAMAVSSIALASVGTPAEAAAPVGVLATFSGSGIDHPSGIAAGPDGNLWFANGGSSIGRITPAGVVTTFSTGITGPWGIAAGPDGNMWFTNQYVESIGRITRDGVVSRFTGTGISYPNRITAGPDGAMWFTNSGNNSIGRITRDGVVSNFTGAGMNYPRGIAAGSDGALWFTNHLGNSIGRITTNGAVTTYTDPTIVAPEEIVAGPDLKLWFNNADTSIGRISTAGVVSNFRYGGNQGSVEITTGPDGNLWFPIHNGEMGRMTPTGVATIFAGTVLSGGSVGVAPGADGNIWFTSYDSSFIGRMGTGPPIAANDSGTTGYGVDLVVAAPGVLANDSGTGLTAALTTAPAAISGTVTLAADGSYTFKPGLGFTGNTSFGYTVTDVDGHTATATVTVKVTRPAPPTPCGGGWQYNGTAVKRNACDLVLTPATPTVAGTAFWPLAQPTAKLASVTFDSVMGQGTGGDGLALVFADPARGATPTSLGGYGGRLGIGGVPSATVNLDTFQNAGDPSSNFVGLCTMGATPTSQFHCASTGAVASPLRDSTTLVTHHVVVTVSVFFNTPYVSKVTVDGATVVTGNLALPRSALVGFSGATGGRTDIHQVSNLAFAFRP